MQQDISAYYNQTQNHYERWWQLDKGMSLHYGLWYPETRNFLEALNNTNSYMASQALINKDHHILEAGCGVGGAAIYLARQFSARVTGISLSERQIATAKENANKHGVSELVDFKLADYSNTGFADHSFDMIWACESSSSSPDKKKTFAEWFRLLKPGGKVILLDFFKAEDVDSPACTMLDKWSELWAMSPLVTVNQLTANLDEVGFDIAKEENLLTRVIPTIRRMYWSYLLGSLPARLYNLFFGAQKYSRNHYKSGLYQYRTYKHGLWSYHAILAEKK